MTTLVEYTPDRIANVAKSVATTHARLIRDGEKLQSYILAGINAGHSTAKIERDMLSRCSNRSEMASVLAIIEALPAQE